MSKRIYHLKFMLLSLGFRILNLSSAPRPSAHTPRKVLPAKGAFIAFSVAVTALVSSSCERERREFSPSTAAAPVSAVRQSELRPGAPAADEETRVSYEDNAYAMSEGKRLFEWFNCVGCHAQGGGAIGPPLMDDEWVYGSNPENIFASIIEGRPNGMPSFRDKVPTDEVWQIVAYVRSLSGQAPKDAAPTRGDHMQAKQPEQSKEKEQPKPARAERRQ